MRRQNCVSVEQTFDRTTPIPHGRQLFYECLKCGDIIPSEPDDSIGCSCGDVFVDVDAFRVMIQDYTQFRLLHCLP
jgi:hypothetical protein